MKEFREKFRKIEVALGTLDGFLLDYTTESEEASKLLTEFSYELEEKKIEINLVKREIERVFHEKNRLALSENPPLEKIKTLEKVWENAIKRHSQLVRIKEGMMEIIDELEKEEE